MHLLQELTRSLLARCACDLEAMRTAARRGDLGTIERLAHRMVGAAGALELDELADCARMVSRAARSASTQSLAPLLDLLSARVAAGR